MTPRHHDTMVSTMQPWCNLSLDNNLIDLLLLMWYSKKAYIIWSRQHYQSIKQYLLSSTSFLFCLQIQQPSFPRLSRGFEDNKALAGRIPKRLRLIATSALGG